MKFADELRKARGELTAEEKAEALETKTKENFETIKNLCKEANAKKERSISFGGEIHDISDTVDKLVELLKNEDLEVSRYDTCHNHHYLGRLYRPILGISW